MKTSEQINEVATALVKAQAELKPAIKDSVNPAFRSKYADLAAVWEAWHAVGPVNGIATVQDVTTEERGVAVSTRLLHTSGQWLEFGPLTVPLTKFDAHGVGSATSYAKRYGLSAAVGVVAEEDDDGNAAQESTKGPQGRAAQREALSAQARQHAAENGPYADRERAKTQTVIDKETGEVTAGPPHVTETYKDLMARREKLPDDVRDLVTRDEALLHFPPSELTDMIPGYLDAIADVVTRRKLSPKERGDLKEQFFGNRTATLDAKTHNPFFIYALFKHLRTDLP